MAKILVIDDEPNVIEYVCRLAESQGHSTVRAATCAEGIEAAADASVDIIIADIFLPDSPGNEKWLETVKDKAAGRPFVFITGYPAQELIEKSEKLGAAGLLSKPFEMPFIKELLAKLSGQKQNDR